MKAMALDQAAPCGWAVGGIDGSRPHWGTKVLPTRMDREGETFFTLEKFITEMHERFLFEALFFEQTFLPNHNDFPSIYQQCGLTATIQTTCHRLGLRCEQAPIAAWRKRFLGTAKAPPGLKGSRATRWFKEQAMIKCAERGWLVDDHNAAEALGILDFGLCTLDIGYLHRTAPLFRRAEDRVSRQVLS